MPRIIRLGTLVLLLLITSCSTGYSTQLPKAAPDFQLKTLDGKTVSLNQLRGTPVLINFWASWCQPCRDEMPYLQQVYTTYKATGLVLYEVDEGESPDAINKFFTDNGLSLPVLLDSDRTVGPAYQITGIPETFLIDKNGIIRKWQIGAYPNVQTLENDLKVILPTFPVN